MPENTAATISFTYVTFAATGFAKLNGPLTAATRIRGASNRMTRVKVGDYILQLTDGSLRRMDAATKLELFGSSAATAAAPTGPPTGLGHGTITTTTIPVTWTNADTAAQTEIWVNGVLTLTIAANTATGTVTGLVTGTAYSIKVRHKRFGQYSAFTTASVMTTA